MQRDLDLGKSFFAGMLGVLAFWQYGLWLNSEHTIICQTFVSSSTVADTALALGGFTKVNETLFLPPSRFISSQGNTQAEGTKSFERSKAECHGNATPGKIWLV